MMIGLHSADYLRKLSIVDELKNMMNRMNVKNIIIKNIIIYIYIKIYINENYLQNSVRLFILHIAL